MYTFDPVWIGESQKYHWISPQSIENCSNKALKAPNYYDTYAHLRTLYQQASMFVNL